MSYTAQAELARDFGVQLRVAACAATLHIDNPAEWAAQRMWQLSAHAGMVDAYESQGSDSITDTMILEAVETITAAEPPPTITDNQSPAE